MRIPALIFRTVSDSDGVSCFLPRHGPRSAARFRDATAGQSLLTSLDFCQTGRSWDEKAHKRPQGSVSNFPFQLEASRCSPIIESFSPKNRGSECENKQRRSKVNLKTQNPSVLATSDHSLIHFKRLFAALCFALAHLVLPTPR